MSESFANDESSQMLLNMISSLVNVNQGHWLILFKLSLFLDRHMNVLELFVFVLDLREMLAFKVAKHLFVND